MLRLYTDQDYGYTFFLWIVLNLRTRYKNISKIKIPILKEGSN